MADASPSGFPVLGRLLLLGLIWGVTFPVAHLGVAAGADPVLLVALVLAIASVAMLPLAVLSGAARPRGRDALASAGVGALLIGGINLPLYWGLESATGGTAAIVYATAPLISVAVLAILGSGAAVTRRQLAALGIGLGGVVVLAYATVGGAALAGVGPIVAFGIGATCQGTGAVAAGRLRPAGEDAWGLTFEFVGGAVAAAVVLPVLAPGLAFPITPATIGSLLYVALLTMVAGYTLFFDLIHRAGPVRANQVTFLNPVVAIAVGVVVFAERFVPLEAVALALIVLALALLQPRRQPRAEPVPVGRSTVPGVAVPRVGPDHRG
ncbi:MAG TPA: DMT family transporter [Thermoplasmata archaeon]|nr:DMT family transporter [Thermoplasmata archaeon]